MGPGRVAVFGIIKEKPHLRQVLAMWERGSTNRARNIQIVWDVVLMGLGVVAAFGATFQTAAMRNVAAAGAVRTSGLPSVPTFRTLLLAKTSSSRLPSSGGYRAMIKMLLVSSGPGVEQLDWFGPGCAFLLVLS